TKKPKEPSRRKLQSLQAVLKMLVESPKIQRTIRPDYVKKSGFAGNDFTDHECQVVAELANTLRPFIPKRRKRSDDKGFQDSLAHVALRAPIVMIANSVLRATGYSNFTRRISPQPSTASLHGLQLGAVGLYETLCGKGERQFDVQDSDGEKITNYLTVQSSAAMKQTLFASFFDVKKMNEICSKHGLVFRD
ncbi:hypothetical protein BGX34_007488, partial [Mortierella sp. NVP85]